MAILNAGMLEVYEEIDENLLKLIEDVIFDREESATENLIEFASSVGSSSNGIKNRRLAVYGFEGQNISSNYKRYYNQY